MFARSPAVVTQLALTRQVIEIIKVAVLRDPLARIDHVVRDRARGAAARDAHRIARENQQPHRAPLRAFVPLAKFILDSRMRQPRVLAAESRTRRQLTATGSTARTWYRRRHRNKLRVALISRTETDSRARSAPASCADRSPCASRARAGDGRMTGSHPPSSPVRSPRSAVRSR